LNYDSFRDEWCTTVRPATNATKSSLNSGTFDKLIAGAEIKPVPVKLHYYKKNQADASSIGSALPADFYRKQNRLSKLLASQDQGDRDKLN